MKWNKLLERQISKYLPQNILDEKMFQSFLHAVNESYNGYERDCYLAENAFKISEEEFIAVNKQFERELILKRLSIDQLKEAIRAFGEEGFSLDSDNLLDIVGFLKLQIDNRKQAEQAISIKEEKYRNIIANMNLGLLEVDNEEVIQYANQSFCEMSGYSMEELYGQQPADLFAKESDLELIKSKNELRKNGISDAYETTFRNKRGELKWWLVSGAPSYNDSGQPVGSIGIYLDITEQKELLFKLNEASEYAERSARAKEDFLANMSHEIRTPMNAILGMSRQLEKSTLSDKQRFFLNTINTATDHLMIVINDILDISKIEAGKLHLEHIGFKPEEVIRHSLRVMQPRADEKGLQLSCDIAAEIATVVLGDPHRLNQVLLNLISNGIKFTEKGAVRVLCTLEERLPGTQVIKITVKDTGIGIDGEYLPKIFEKFMQEDKTTARKYGGTGLGMAISRQLVELMNGRIYVQSKKGYGTEVVLSIPFETGTEADLPERGRKVTNMGLLKGRKVLLAEDNEMNRMVVRTILEGYGVMLTEAVNGEEAVSKLKEGAFDLVLMDVQMPVMSGLEATVVIRDELKLDIPIIALTANAINGESQRCLETGMNDFVAKPFEEDDLLSKIAEHLFVDGLLINDRVDGNRIAQSNQAPLFNLSRLEEIGDADFMRKIIALFIELVPRSVAEIRAAFDAGNWSVVRSVAHKIKPTIETMGMFSLMDVVLSLEHVHDEGATREKIDLDIKTLEGVIKDVVEQLDTYSIGQ